MNETSTPEVNSRQFWESYMASDWDANSGRQQTRLFAKYFLDAVTLPADAKTIAGCQLRQRRRDSRISRTLSQSATLRRGYFGSCD